MYTEFVTEYLRETDLAIARMDRCAEELCISTNTLLRRLNEEGTTYERLRMAEQRRRAAQAVADNPAITGWELAEILGLSCSQSAVRFFQRAFGVSITQFKSQLQGISACSEQ